MNKVGIGLLAFGAGFIFGAGTAFLDGAPRWYCAEALLIGLLAVVAGSLVISIRPVRVEE